MQTQTLELPDDIAFFIVEGTHRIATISMNDYGFLLSAPNGADLPGPGRTGA